MRKKFWTHDKISHIRQVMQYATGYDQAVRELRKQDIITNSGVIRQVILKHNIEKPKIKHGGSRK